VASRTAIDGGDLCEDVRGAAGEGQQCDARDVRRQLQPLRNVLWQARMFRNLGGLTLNGVSLNAAQL
jgi:hypothetical protein